MTAVFRITNGTDSVDLINGPIRVKDMSPAYPQYKMGGVRRSSPMADGERLIDTSFDTIIETMTIAIEGTSQDAVIATIVDLETLLQEAKDYWVATSRTDVRPVWLEKKASKETNTAYAVVSMGKFEGLSNWFAQPFLQPGCHALQDDVILQIERGHWQSNVPGEASCVATSSRHVWNYSEWLESTAAPTAEVNAMMRTSNGVIIAAMEADGEVLRSVDDGENWVAPSAAPAGDGWALCEDGSYVYIYTSGGLYRSSDDGDNWALVTTDIKAGTRNSIVYAPWGALLAIQRDPGSADVYEGMYSYDGGTTWTVFSNLGGIYAQGICLHVSTGLSPHTYYVYIGHSGSHGGSSHIVQYRLDAPGVGSVPMLANILREGASSAVVSFYEPGDGFLYAGVTGQLYRKTVNSIVAPSRVASGFNGILYSFTYEESIGKYLTTGIGRVYESTNMVSWSYSAGGATQFYSLVYGESKAFAGENGEIYERSSTAVGQLEPECESGFVSNRHSVANITHAYVYDASLGTYTRIFPEDSFPVELLPNPVGVGDILYLGCNTDNTAGWLLDNFVFDIDTVNTGITGVWEIVQAGPSWITPTGLVDGTDSFSRPGINAVHINWEDRLLSAVAINGVTGTWTRFRVTGVEAGSPVPTQQNRNIYSTSWPYLTVDTVGDSGPIPSRIHIEVSNAGDHGGPTEALAEDLTDGARWANAVYVGLRSLSRGENFTPFFNCAPDNQNITGVSSVLGNDCSHVGDSYSIANRTPQRYHTLFEPAAPGPIIPRVTFTIEPELATTYYGTFQVFVRCWEPSTSGVPAIPVRVKTSVGDSNVVSSTGISRVKHVSGPWQILSLGKLVIPHAHIASYGESGGALTIILEAGCDTDGYGMRFLDVILFPVDEWACICLDGVASIGSSLQFGTKLMIDSTINPKIDLRALVKTNDEEGFIQSVWTTDSNGPAQLQADERQKLWFLFGVNRMERREDNSGVDDKDYFQYVPGAGTYSFVNTGTRIGQTIYNLTDGSHGVITDVNDSQIFAELTGGTDNDFDDGDVILIIKDEIASPPQQFHRVSVYQNSRYLTARGAR